MVSVRRTMALLVPIALVASLGGCSLIQPKGTDVALTGIAECALGKTWNLDTAALATQVQAWFGKNGIGATGTTIEGTQTMEWGLDSSVVITTDYTITATADPAIANLSAHKGTATGTSYISGTVAIPRDWDGTGLAITNTATADGAPLDPPPFPFPATDLDDAVGVELTCDGTTLTTHPRGGDITMSWTTG